MLNPPSKYPVLPLSIVQWISYLCIGSLIFYSPIQAQPIGLPSISTASAADLSAALEAQLGASIMAQARRDPSYIEDAEINQYLNHIGHQLASQAPGPIPKITLFAVRDPQINAFAMPGGYIGVNSGLVIASQHESELAGVLAHEIGHVVQRHIARSMTQSNQNQMLAIASIAAMLLTGLAGGGGNLAMGVGAFGQAAAIDRQLGFSRAAEQEADRLGLQMLAKAGYDPKGMVQMFAMLMRAAQLNEGRSGGAWNSTHPLSTDRMADLQNRLETLPFSARERSSDYFYIRNKLRTLQSQDSSDLNLVSLVLKDETQSPSSQQRSAGLYGLARISLQNNQSSEAQSYLKQASAEVPETPALALLAVEIATAKSELMPAMQLAHTAYQRWPNQLALMLAYAQSLQNLNRHEQAQTFLLKHIPKWADQEPRFYQLLAQTEQATGQQVAARQHMANYYELMGLLSAASTQLIQAQNLSKDFYEQSQIDVELKRIKNKIMQEQQLLAQFKR